MAAHKIIDTRGVELIQDSIGSTVPRIQQNALNQFNLLLEAGSLPGGQSKIKGGAGGEHLRNMLLGVQHASRHGKGHGANKSKSKTGSILISLVRILWRGRSALLRAKAAVGLRAVFACKRGLLLFAFQDLKLLSIVDRVVSQMDVAGMVTQSGGSSANPGSNDDERYMRVNVTALLRQLLACGASVLLDTERVLNRGGAAPKSRQASMLAETVKDFEIILFLLSSSCLRLPLLQSTNAISVLSHCLELTDQVSVPLRVQVQQALLLALEAAVQHPEVLDCCWADVVTDMMPALARNFLAVAIDHSVPSQALLSARDPAPHYMLKLVSVSLSSKSTGSVFGSALMQLELLEPIVSLLQSRVHVFHGNAGRTLMLAVSLYLWCIQLCCTIVRRL